MRREEKIVDNLVKKHKTSNPFELCELLNVDVRYQNLGSIRGMYRCSKRNKFITLNSSLGLSSMEYKVVCAHELGHLLMHSDENRIMMDRAIHSGIYKPSRYENEANRFAAYLLMREYGIPSCNIAELSRHTGFPICYLQDILC